MSRVLPTLALFVVSLGYGVVVPLLPQLSGGVAQVTPGMISAVYAAYAAAKIAAQVPGGVWADRIGADRVLPLALALFTFSLAGFLWPGGIGWFSIVRALEGAATGLVYPAVFALVLRGGEQGSGKRIGLTVGLASSGLLLGPVLGGVLSPISPRLPVAVALLMAAALTVWAATVKREPANASGRTLKTELRSIGALAANLGFLALVLPIAFNKLTFSSFQGLLPLYGEGPLGLSVQGVTGLFALTGIVFGVFQGIGGVLADRFAPRSLVLVLTVPLLLTLLAMSQAISWPAFTAAYASYIACSSLIFTATLKHAARVFGTDDTYGGVFGVLGTLTDLMTVVGPLLFLGLYGPLGAQIFALMAAMGVLSGIGYLLFGGRLRSPLEA